MANATAKPAIQIQPDQQALFRQAAQRVAELLKQTLAQRPQAFLALAGGSTPRGLYQQLGQLPTSLAPDWQRIQFFFGDERAVPPEHPESNYRMARETLFEPLGIAASQIHRIQGEAPPEQALADYRQRLQALPQQDGRPCFDLILLGMGDDGHIASLFPHSALLAETEHSVCSAELAGRGRRYSLSLPVLNQARHLLLLVSGAGKAATVQQALGTIPAQPPTLPVQQLHPQRLEWFLDQAAAQQLPGENVS
ncbi:MAG: 6-phosphogluconolactonase [Thiohalomonadaceae bacterium]